MRVITTNHDLETFVAEASNKDFLVVDTEFMREKTFWPILCLIQAAVDGAEAIIDPLAEGLDLAPFLELLTNPAMTKVFHAARQDLEIFYRLIGSVPAPLFDSQIAAMACGFGDQIGYEPLMKTLVHAKIDKGSRFTDWARRPLTPSQLSYALSDVTYLRDAYPILQDRLKKAGRGHWVEEEMKALEDPSLYFVEPSAAWKRLKMRGLKPKDLGPVMKLAEWREEQAQSRDIPRNRVLKDEAIIEIARLHPKSPSDLARSRSISSGFEKSNAGTEILNAVKAGAQMDRASLPSLENPQKPKPPADVVDLLKVLLKRQCEIFDVAPKLIASSSDLEAIALNDNASVNALAGWRREVFGAMALRLKAGEIALKINNGAIEVVEALTEPQS